MNLRAWFRRWPALAVVVVLCAAAVSPAAAQARCFGGDVDDPRGCRFSAPGWVGEFATLSANSVLGGLTAGFVRHLRGGSFRDGFLDGLVGGSASWLGKRIAATSAPGAGLVGRLVSATGASAVRNAGNAEPLFSRLTLPAGPVWLDVDTRKRGLRARVDPAALTWLIYGVAEEELTLDWGETLSAGTPIFRTDGKLMVLGRDSVHAAGVTRAGVVYLAAIPAYGPETLRRFLAHERTHVLQEDQLSILWTDPLAGWALQRVPGAGNVTRHVAFNFSTELMRLVNGLIAEHGDRPWELEAIFFAR